MSDRPVFRFAPSPNGELHLGHALSALLNAEAARRLGGRLLMRIEDIDRERCTRERSVVEDLDWLGIAYERPVLRQSENFPAYEAALSRLKAAGFAYPCFASRSEIANTVKALDDWPRDPDGVPLYPGLWRGAEPELIARARAKGRPLAWRLDMAKALSDPSAQPLPWRETGTDQQGRSLLVPARPLAWGDIVVARKEVPTSYHLAVVVDDAAQGVTHVVRGMDLFHATSVHMLLQALLGLPRPAYHHHRLILGPDGRKLSKSLASTSLRALRQEGASPDDVRRLIGWDPDADLQGLIKARHSS